MPFSDAIPLNSVAQSQPSRFDMGTEREGRRPTTGSSKAPRQAVNISQETLLRIARSKLSHAVHQKLAYGRDGTFGREETIGQFLSAKV